MWPKSLAPHQYFTEFREKKSKIGTLTHGLLSHFRIFCSMNHAEEVTQLDHKPKILVIKECLYPYTAIFNACWISQPYIFLFFFFGQDGQIEICHTCHRIAASYFIPLLIQSALLLTNGFLLIFLFWTVTTKKFCIWTFSLKGQS